jgi:acyl carrier protein
LPRFFSLANYGDIHFRTITAHTYKIDKSIFLGAESSAIGMTLVKQGYLDSGVFNKLIINWSKMAHDSENVMTRELYCAYGTKNQDSVNIAHHRQGIEAVAPLKEKKPTAFPPDLELVSPETETEKRIASVWEEHLGLDEVGTNISFFDTGGESYLIPLIVESLSDRFSIEVEITDLFEFPTIADLALFIDSRNQDTTSDSVVSSAELQRNATGKNSKQNPFARLKRKK